MENLKPHASVTARRTWSIQRDSPASLFSDSSSLRFDYASAALRVLSAAVSKKASGLVKLHHHMELMGGLSEINVAMPARLLHRKYKASIALFVYMTAAVFDRNQPLKIGPPLSCF
jgi:hypothetical protein